MLIGTLIELLSLFTKLDPNRIVFNSTNNTNFNFNSKYLFLYLLNHENKYNVYFVVNDKIALKKLKSNYGDHFISTNTLKGLFVSAKAKFWISSVLETPYLSLPIVKNKSRIVYHLGHGVPLKKIGLAEANISKFQYLNRWLRTKRFTHVLSYSQFYKSIMYESFKNPSISFVYLGQPRNDQLTITNEQSFDHVSTIYPQITRSSKLILYSPTWRDYSITQFFPFSNLNPIKFNEQLKKENIYLLLREHPYYPSVVPEDFQNLSNVLFFNSDIFPEIMDYLSLFDKLITDYSSIYLDFLCLNKPIAFIPYDLDEYIANVGFNVDYFTISPGPKITSFSDFQRFIFTAEDLYHEDRARVMRLINCKSSGNCKENTDFINSLG